MIQEITEREGNRLKAYELCRIAGVSRSGYYKWLSSQSVRDACEDADKRDFELILAAYRHRGYGKGARGIYMRLLHENTVMNVKKIRRLMKKYGLRCKMRQANPYRRMANALKTSNVAENLVNREFEAHGARHILLTDITYLKRADSQFSYLCTIIDAYTKQILSHALSSSLEVDFVLEAVRKLVASHELSLTTETLLHSDQGVHYTSHKFIELVENSDLRRSMSRRGNCWDNAPQESFFGHMKDEIDILGCVTHEDIASVVEDWLDYYNNDRYQWELARLSPNEFYEYITTGQYPLSTAAPPILVGTKPVKKEKTTMTINPESLCKWEESMRIRLNDAQRAAVLERFGVEPTPHEWTQQDIAVQIRNFIECGEFTKTVIPCFVNKSAADRVTF